MRLLVFGAYGQLGHALCKLEDHGKLGIVPLGREDADITHDGSVERAVASGNCDIVINAAAYTAVDRAETDAQAAHAVNRTGAENVARAAARHGLPVIHLSTDYVFDGTRTRAYREDDPVAPLGVYGASKAAGEHAVRAANERHLIVRTSWVFSAQGHNFVKTMLRLAGNHEEIGVVDDQWGCPTPADDLAHGIVELCARLRPGAWGTYHYCGAGRTTWFRFAREIFNERERLTGLAPPNLRPLASGDYPTAAPRPVNSELDCTRIATAFALAPRPWHEGLTRVLSELLT